MYYTYSQHTAMDMQLQRWPLNGKLPRATSDRPSVMTRDPAVCFLSAFSSASTSRLDSAGGAERLSSLSWEALLAKVVQWNTYNYRKWYLCNKSFYVGGGSPTELTKLWDALRGIAEPTGLIGDTLMCVAKERTEQQVAATGNDLEDNQDQGLLARSESSSSSRSSSSRNYTVEDPSPGVSQGSNTQVYTQNPTRFETCGFLSQCEGKQAQDNVLGVCCVCIAKSHVTADSTCCKHCVMTKIMKIAYSAHRTTRSLEDEFLCLKCWTMKKLLRCYKEEDMEAHFEHIYQQCANAHHKRTAKEVKQVEDILLSDRFHVLEAIKDMQKRASQLMLCMEMEYFDEAIQNAGRVLLSDCALLFEKPPLVTLPVVEEIAPEEYESAEVVSEGIEYKVHEHILRNCLLIVPLFHRLRYDSNVWKRTVKGQGKLPLKQDLKMHPSQSWLRRGRIGGGRCRTRMKNLTIGITQPSCNAAHSTSSTSILCMLLRNK